MTNDTPDTTNGGRGEPGRSQVPSGSLYQVGQRFVLLEEIQGINPRWRLDPEKFIFIIISTRIHYKGVKCYRIRVWQAEAHMLTAQIRVAQSDIDNKVRLINDGDPFIQRYLERT